MATQNPSSREGLIKTGETAPDFALQTAERADWKLADAVKKGDVVLCFFPFAFTGTCGTEMACISREMADWTRKGAQVVGISCDSPFTLKAWAEKEGYKHTLLSDMRREVCRAYGLFWADMYTTQRGTVIIGRSADGHGKVKFAQARQPGNAMKWEEVLAVIS